MTHKPCKKQSEMTPEERKLAHAAKMRLKRKRDQFNREYLERFPNPVFANLSMSHPNSGETPSECTKRMKNKS